MRRIVVLLIVLILLLFKKSYSRAGGNNNDSLELLISGKVFYKGVVSDRSYKVELILNNQVIDSLEVKNKRSFKFKLNKNEYYGIRISKKGFVSKLISVCTDMEPNSKSGSHHFHFDTSLINESEMDRLNKDVLDFPIAVISFNEKKEVFSYNKKYTAHIKRKTYEKDCA